jgi:hypothetical protein
MYTPWGWPTKRVETCRSSSTLTVKLCVIMYFLLFSWIQSSGSLPRGFLIQNPFRICSQPILLIQPFVIALTWILSLHCHYRHKRHSLGLQVLSVLLPIKFIFHRSFGRPVNRLSMCTNCCYIQNLHVCSRYVFMFHRGFRINRYLACYTII